MKCRYNIDCNILGLKYSKDKLSFCPRIQNIENEIQEKVLQPALNQKGIMDREQFKRFIDNQVGCMNQKLMELQNTVSLYNNHGKYEACNWNYCYHWGLAFIENLNKLLEPQLQKESTNSEKLFNRLAEYGFFEMEKVKYLSLNKQKELVELMIINGVPYTIAMFEYVGFVRLLYTEQAKTKNELNKIIGKCLDCGERCVKGNLAVLNEKSKEDKTRYTAYQYKERVEKEYQNLK